MFDIVEVLKTPANPELVEKAIKDCLKMNSDHSDDEQIIISQCYIGEGEIMTTIIIRQDWGIRKIKRRR